MTSKAAVSQNVYVLLKTFSHAIIFGLLTRSLGFKEEEMPDFEVVPLDEARLKTLSGRQGQIVKQYSQYIEQLEGGQAGKLHAASNEKLTTIRRRLVTTARLLGKELIIKRTGDELYFWIKTPEEEEAPQRRRRSRRNPD
jgi:hypothetical protein